MLAKKREDGSKRRKRRDIDIINDNDDIIDQLIQDMRGAADVCIQTTCSIDTLLEKKTRNSLFINLYSRFEM